MSWSQVILFNLYLNYLPHPRLCLWWNGVKILAPELRLPDVIKAPNLGLSSAAAGVQHHVSPFDFVSPQGLRRTAASKAILLRSQNRTGPTVFEWSGGVVPDHMFFFLAVIQDDLIKSTATFYTSETKLLLLRRFHLIKLPVFLWQQLHSSSPPTSIRKKNCSY